MALGRARGCAAGHSTSGGLKPGTGAGDSKNCAQDGLLGCA